MSWSSSPDSDGEGLGPQPLSAVLDKVLAGLGAPGVDVVVAISERWAELVGAEVAPHVRPVAVECGRLKVLADDPAWASHLRWSETDLLRRMATVIGDGVVERVVTQVGRPR